MVARAAIGYLDRTMLRLALTLLCCLALAAPAWAGWDEGEAAFERADYERALQEFRPLAEQGDVRAQFSVGFMYYYGHGVPQDRAEAVKWYRRAAEQGDARAQNNLGIMYDESRGVPQDDAEALKWYRRAAEQGHAVAQSQLGVMYGNGRGVPQDYVQAHLWFNLSAAQGNDDTARKNRELVAENMTSAQIAEAEKLAREWQPKTE